MAADIEMLPLPQAEEWEDTTAWAKRYARAVAEHNVRFLTHELANAECAIDTEQAGRKKAEAEIEALRVRADAMAREAIKHEARAERLAEALRLIAAPIRPDGTWNRDREACRQIAHDALIGHEQEGKDG